MSYVARVAGQGFSNTRATGAARAGSTFRNVRGGGATTTTIGLPVSSLTATGYAPSVGITSSATIGLPVSALSLIGYAPTVSATTATTRGAAYQARVRGQFLQSTAKVQGRAATSFLNTSAGTAPLTGNIPATAALAMTGYAPTVSYTVARVGYQARANGQFHTRSARYAVRSRGEFFISSTGSPPPVILPLGTMPLSFAGFSPSVSIGALSPDFLLSRKRTSLLLIGLQ